MTNFFNKDILNNNSLEYLFNNELDYLFNKDVINKDIILTFDTKIKAIYQIQNFNLKNKDNRSEYNINRKFNNKNNFTFYKLGIIQIPPKRIIVKGFDD